MMIRSECINSPHSVGGEKDDVIIMIQNNL